jgi:glycosyltransferase involved in cell wall biosynthesis
VSERLRIGYLVQQFLPEVGAGPARVSEMASRWRDAGADVTIITAMPNRPEGRIHAAYRGRLVVREEWEGIRVLRSWLYASPRHGFARTVLNNLTFMATGAAHAIASAGKLDVLIASSPPFFPHIAGVTFSALRRVPLVLEVRDLWPDYLVEMGVLRNKSAQGALFALERALFRRASRVVVVTESFRQRIIDKGVPADRIDVISNGVDTNLYYRANEPPPIPELAAVPGETVVGYLGNFGAGQGLATLLDAAATLEQRGERVRIVLAGDGPDAAQLRARADELRLTRLSIHPPIPKSATRAFYNACDICVVPLAPFEVLGTTVPSKIFEIMACERPLVASLSGEGARIVSESGGGLVTPPGDANALADAIRRLLDTPIAERRRMGWRARAYVGAHFGRDTLSATYLDVLREAAGRGTRRAPRPLPA